MAKDRNGKVLAVGDKVKCYRKDKEPMLRFGAVYGVAAMLDDGRIQIDGFSGWWFSSDWFERVADAEDDPNPELTAFADDVRYLCESHIEGRKCTTHRVCGDCATWAVLTVAKRVLRKDGEG